MNRKQRFNDIIEGLPKPVFKLLLDTIEGLEATGRVLSDEEVFYLKMGFIIGTIAMTSYIEEPQNFKKLTQHINRIVLETLIL